MELNGRVIEVKPIQQGTSAATGKKWMVLIFIVETIENYPRKVAFEIFGEQRIKDNKVGVGNEYTIFFDLESREVKHNWFTSARVWKIKDLQQMPAEQPPTEPEDYQEGPVSPDVAQLQQTMGAQPFDPNQPSDDLPF